MSPPFVLGAGFKAEKLMRCVWVADQVDSGRVGEVEARVV